MRIPFLFCPILVGVKLFSSPDCCPPQTTSPCECMQNPVYSDLSSARPCIGSCQPSSYGAALEMSFLVWEGREEGLQFVVKNNPIMTPASNLTANINGKMRGINFTWQPAFKFNFEQDFSNSWDFDMRWTYFYSRSTASHHATVNATTTSGLFPLWVLPQSYEASPNVFGKARGIWNLHLNTVDLELGYSPFLTPKLNLRLHLGVKGISISQRFSILYSDGIDDGTVTLLPSKTALRNRCLGAGPRFGFNSQWGLNKGWSILADGAASFTLSDFSIKRKDFDQATRDDHAIHYSAQSKFKESFYAFRPNFEGLLGFGWDTCYGKRKQYAFDFKAAYEVQFFSEQNMMRQLASQPISFSAFSMRGDLHCHGITTTFRFGF